MKNLSNPRIKLYYLVLQAKHTLLQFLVLCEAVLYLLVLPFLKGNDAE